MDLKRPIILIVEDEEDIAIQLQAELEQEGFLVRLAANGVEALRSLKRDGAPHLILLDLLLPEMDGWQFLRARAEHEIWKHVPVIAISAVAYRGAPGAAAVLPKPINVTTLLQIIQQVRSHSPRATG